MTYLKALRFAISFLTILPCRKNTAEGPLQTPAGVLAAFPLVGLLIGALLVGVDGALTSLFPSMVAAFGDVMFLALITGGLHLDGLADSADALFSGAGDRERRLAIMKDSRIGTMGALALILVLALKASAIGALTAPQRLPVLLLMPVAGRIAMLVIMRVQAYARPAAGLGSLFGRTDLLTLGGSVFFGVGAVLLLIPWPMGLGMLTCSALALGWWIFFCARVLGGFTGDTLGAGCELVELAMVVGFFLLRR